MATTLDPLVVRPTKVHRRGVAMTIAGILLLGGATATTAVLVHDDGHNAPASVEMSTPDSAGQDTLVTRYGHDSGAQQFGAQPFDEQPVLRVGGAR
jgi:hypothetical protein